MDTLGPRLLFRVRTTGHRLFHRFGLHCATHQIRVILISAIVITSLFYPALAIYSSSQPRFLAHFSSQILDPFLAADAISSYDAQHHLRDIWAAHDNLHVREDPVVRARCGVEHTLRVERVLVHSSASAESKALSHQLLRATLRLERRISDTLTARRVPCLRRPDGQCLVVSPLMFWHHEESALMTDVNILHTLRPSNNVSFAGFPIQSQMSEYANGVAGSTVFLALTYFFPERDCLGKTGHSIWRQILEDASKDWADLITETQQPKLIALEYTTCLSSSADTSVLTVFIYLAYLALAITFGQSVRKGLPVHNGIGLIFTGAIEILVSTITSLSVCALVGFRVTMIPWGIFPLVIMFIGAENMFSLVEAVVKTSITLPVKQRIAEGLSRAGTSNSLKVLTYNIILGIIAFFARGATRQFCAFAIVVLVAHWFLVHTFFVAVLSIDLQRLELEELLQQNASLTPPVQPAAPNQAAQPSGRGRKLMTALQGLLRGRATKNISLLLLLATTGTLYFVTYPVTRLSDTPAIPTSIHLAQQRKQDFLYGVADPAWHTWRVLNPEEDPLVHLRIEAPTLLMFHPAGTAPSTTRVHQSHRARPSLSYSWILRTAARMARIVVLPIAATVAALYALLLYLLKDAERLEAQRHRAEGDSLPSHNADPPKAPLAFTALPRAHATDIELLAMSADGRTVAGVSLESEIVLWNSGSAVSISLGAADVLSAGPSNLNAAITALALDDVGALCAVGTGAGVVAIWALPAPAGGRPQRVLRGASSAVTGLHFVNTHVPGVPPPISFARPDQTPAIFVTHENGTVLKLDGAKPDSRPVLVSPPQGCRVLWSTILRISDTSRLVAAFAIEDGSLNIVDLTHGLEPPLASECRLQAGNPADTVARFHACVMELGGVCTLIIAVATEAGIISLWDGTTSSCVAILDEPHGALNALRLCTVPCKPCKHCGALPPDSFVLALTTSLSVQFFRGFLPPDITSSTATSSSRCACPHNTPIPPETPPWGPSLGHHSRRPSTASTSSILPTRSRHASVSEDGTVFPVSGHGVLSRRASEKDSLRRAAADTLAVPENKSDMLVGPLDTPKIPARWRSLVVIWIADTTCERGTWDVAGTRVVGLRRRPRKLPSSGESRTGDARHNAPLRSHETTGAHTRRDYGLSAASLERWEAWTFDPAEVRISASALAALEPATSGLLTRPAIIRETPRLPFTRVGPLVSGRTYCLVGLGNTVGLLTPIYTEKEGN
ncbi:sterol-sensing domain of SREBP cleavage-activation-domain-containing protein [Multifurca ochricompacta]|uniref:Sterol regulatory element-binding protein cleavage-activating protein n=1 Tax=Multifurca ochricompacta TaxID=376703 RepID=A0AAD4M8F5_9AGAM|nr:sterol-sensing domain of SREBP cleavage-activation-domain-containing protein [Multifurca ochricompacta]